MNPTSIVPGIPAADPLALAAPGWLFHALLVLTSVLHLVAMNLLLGGTLLALTARVAGRHGGGTHPELAARIARVLPTLVAVTVTLGVAPLLFVQVLYGRLFYVSSILMGWWWLAIVPVLIATYYGTYALASRVRSTWSLALVAAGLLAISVMLSLNMSLMLWPSLFVARYLADPSGLRPDLIDASTLARWLHMVVGAVGVAGFALAAWSWTMRESAPDLARDGWRLGARSFAVASAVNALAGLSWLGLLPPHALRGLAAGLSGVGLLVVALGLALLTIWLALTVVWVTVEKVSGPRLFQAGGTLALTVAMMVFLRDRLRSVMLAPTGYIVPEAAPQWDVIALFAVCFAAAIGLIGWMVRQYVLAVTKTRQSAAAEP